ncbi:MAG: JAB domain-containing protein [Clostridiales bacterium]|nr:JAB domain-containing protein [Clostridiales bacterium]
MRTDGKMPAGISDEGRGLRNVSIRLVEEPPLLCDEPMDSPEAAVRVLGRWLSTMDRELVCVINFRSDLRPICMSVCSVGALDESIVHPREIMKSAILANASSFMLVHCHPSGSLKPSQNDVAVTDRMQRVGEILGIRMLDHIITGHGEKYYSFNERGRMTYSTVRYASEVGQLGRETGLAAEEEAAAYSRREEKRPGTIREKTIHRHRHR